jgi:hypothetical protein
MARVQKLSEKIYPPMKEIPKDMSITKTYDIKSYFQPKPSDGMIERELKRAKDSGSHHSASDGSFLASRKKKFGVK